MSIGHDVRSNGLIQLSNSQGTRSHSRGAISVRAVQNMSLEKIEGAGKTREDRVPVAARRPSFRGRVSSLLCVTPAFLAAF